MVNLIKRVFKRVFGNNDMSKKDIVFLVAAFGTMALFGVGNILVVKQLREIDAIAAKYEERRVDMCFTFKVHAAIYHFDNVEMMGYCHREVYDLPPITPLPIPGTDS